MTASRYATGCFGYLKNGKLFLVWAARVMGRAAWLLGAVAGIMVHA